MPNSLIGLAHRQSKTEEDRQRRERTAVQKAKEEQKAIVYIDTDGCEVAVMPAGHVFYNVADWW